MFQRHSIYYNTQVVMFGLTTEFNGVTLRFPNGGKPEFDELIKQHGDKLHDMNSVCPAVSPGTNSFVPVESKSLGIKFNVEKQHKNYMQSVLRELEQLSKS